MATAERLTPLHPLPLNGAFRLRRNRDEVYGPFTGKELRLYLDLDGGTDADQVVLTESDATLSDGDYVIDFLAAASWTRANLSAGRWTARLYADETYVGGARFEAFVPGETDHDPDTD